MSTIGKGTLSLRKKDYANSRSAAIGYTRVVFAHKAAGGESSISLQSLTAPSEMLSNGFVQPVSSLLSDLNIYAYRNNLTLQSSVRGVLWDYTSYTVASNSIINFVGFTLLPNEIITGTIDSVPRDGLVVADGTAISSTGPLAVGQTDFNVNGVFEINKYPTQQAGAVLVYRNGLLQARCAGNDLTNSGSYIEVPVVGGFGTLIRFKTAPTSSADAIIVTSNGAYFERPTASSLAAVEKLGGQMDVVIKALADATGRAISDFQSAANSVDVAGFGSRVIAAENTVATLNTNVSTLNTVVNALNNPSQNKVVNNGYVTLPGGMIMQWGNSPIGASSGSQANIFFSNPFPANVVSIMGNFIGAVSGTSDLVVNSYARTGFTMQRGNASNLDGSLNSFFWMAIGY